MLYIVIWVGIFNSNKPLKWQIECTFQESLRALENGRKLKIYKIDLKCLKFRIEF